MTEHTTRDRLMMNDLVTYLIDNVDVANHITMNGCFILLYPKANDKT